MRGFCPACGGQTRVCGIGTAPAVLDDNEHECVDCGARYKAEQLMTVEPGPKQVREAVDSMFRKDEHDCAMTNVHAKIKCGKCYWCQKELREEPARRVGMDFGFASGNFTYGLYPGYVSMDYSARKR